MTKVLLIFPPFTLKETFGNLSKVGNYLQPLGIAYIGAVLERAGFEVKIIDAPVLGLNVEEIIAETKKYEPDFIGISSSTVSFYRTAELAKLLKKITDSPLIIGGPHVTALPEETMNSSVFDIGTLGEGEETIVELIKTILKKGDLRKVSGIIFRQKKRLIKTSPRCYISNLDDLPLPARHLMPELSVYHPTPATYKKSPVGTVITSRGCPNQCSFCFRGVFGNKWRYRLPENVVAEMEVLVNKYGAKEIRFWDDTFNVNPSRVKKICKLIIKKKLNIPWTCLCRVNQIELSMLRLMKKAGCWQISFGIEAGNEKVLAEIDKGITKQTVKKVIEMTEKEGIKSLGFFILGLPGETEETMTETINFAKSLPLDAANFTIATPYPGTKLWDLAKSKGFLKDVSYDELTVNLPKKPYFVPLGLNAEVIKKYEKRAYCEFYRNPRFLLRQIRSIKSPQELFRKASAFFTIASI